VAAIGIARGPWVDILELPEVISLGALVMAGLGLLQVGLFDAPLRIGVGLLTIIAGFEVAYGLIEPSLAITALFALVNVGIALVTSYLVMLAAEQGSEEAGL
jgi:sorbitol-specific phosphotransferase system component IIBC